MIYSQNSLERHETSLSRQNKQKEVLIESLREDIKNAAADKESLKQRLQIVIESDENNKTKVSVCLMYYR